MPRQDVNDNRAMHNLQGIDLRKNAESNCAEDMVNVWINSQHYFTNRPMPDVYSAGQTTFNGNYKFACECKTLAGNEAEIDITSAESAPTVAGLTISEANDDSGEIWIQGPNLESVRTILWITPDGGALVSEIDFSFYYDREHSRIAIVLKEGGVYDDYDYFVLISPYGWISTQYVGNGTDYYFGDYGEYRIRTSSWNGAPQLCFEAKQENGAYKQVQVWGDYAVKNKPDSRKHSVVRGLRYLTFDGLQGVISFDDQTDPDNPALVVSWWREQEETTETCFKIEGGKSVGTYRPGETPYIQIDTDWYLGKNDVFKVSASNEGMAISENVDGIYQNLVRFTAQ